MCSGLRFATIKTGSSNYGQILTPHPLPCVTTNSDHDNHVLWVGIYGLQECMANNAKLPVTGTIFPNNGYFSAINLYDPKLVN